MKRILATLALLLAAASAPAIDCEWTADIDRPHVEPFTLADGETAELACRLVRRGRDFDPFATSATIYYQTSGVDRASWAGAWSAPATVTGALLRATLPPSIVPTAPVVHAMIGASGPSGLVYRAAADLRYLPSPGATPNALPLPVQTIDFATVSWTNAPWALASDAGTNYLPITGGTVTGDVFLESTVSSRSVSVVVSGDLYYLTNYDSPITVSFSLPDVDSATIGDAVSATYTSTYGQSHETWVGAVSSAGSDGVAVLFSNGVTVSGISEGGVASVSPSTLSEGRMSIAFSGVDCSWAAVPVLARSRFVTESDLVAATNALYQLLNH